MQDRSYYERMFLGYPELVTTKELREMLGGVCENTALKILRAKQIHHYRIRGAYRIPKECVIDYMLTEEYEKLRQAVEIARWKSFKDGSEKIQLRILILCEQPKTRAELMFMFDIPSKKTFFRLYLRPLLESGKLAMTHPEQPSISTQKYVRVRW